LKAYKTYDEIWAQYYTPEINKAPW